MEQEQRRLTAIVAADVVGYSRLVARDESAALSAVRVLRHDRVEPPLAAHRGRLVKTTGDGFLLEFPSAVQAVRYAIELQESLTANPVLASDDEPLRLRIGINLGDVVIEGGDIFGDGVNVAARLEQIAAPGGIAMSRAVAENVRGRLRVELVDDGPQTLKNIAEPVQVFRIGTNAEPVPTVPQPRATERPSIAVLPFDNLSGDPDQQYFADGVAEDIITDLSRFRSLLVIARNSSFTYRGKTIDVRQVGRELGARYILEGSVRHSGPRMRIAVRVVESDSGSQIWSERYDFAAEDVFTVQDEVMRKITAVLPGRLETAELAKVERKTSESLEAWDFLLRGKYLHHLRNPEANQQAEACFDKSIALDQNFAAAIAWKACTLGQVWNNEWRPREPALLVKINQLIRRAYDLDENDAECHRILCRISLLQRQFDKSEYHLGRALELTPNDPRLLTQRGINSTYLGDAQAAIPWLEQAMRVDPFSASHYEMDLARALYAGGRVLDAIDVLERSTRPNYQLSLLRAACHAELGNDDHGRQAMQDALSMRPNLSVTSVLAGQPWKRAEDSERIANALRRAGLPD